MGDEVYEIVTDQLVIGGVAHVHTLAHLQTVYRLEQGGKYQEVEIRLR